MKRLVSLIVALVVTVGLLAIAGCAVKPNENAPVGVQSSSNDVYRTRVTLNPISPGTEGAYDSDNSGGMNGYIVALYIDYQSTMSSTTDITLTYLSPAGGQLLAKTNNNTDGWFYPRALAQSTAAANATDAWVMLPVDGSIQCSISQTLSGTVGYVDFYWVKP